MLRTLTRTIGCQKLVIIEDQALTGRTYGLMCKSNNRLRVSPAVFKLMQDDFDAVAKDFRVKITSRRKKGIA